jgi:hypothetical protein
MHPDPNFTGLHEIGDPRIRHVLRLRETCTNMAVNVTVRSSLVMCASKDSGVYRKRTRGAQGAYVSDFDTLKPLDATALRA